MNFEFLQTLSKLSHVIPPEDMSLNFFMVILSQANVVSGCNYDFSAKINSH